MSDYSLYVSVALDVAINRLLDYGVPSALVDKVKKGMRVKVPLRGKVQEGMIVELKKESNYPNVQPIDSLISSHPLITPALDELAHWMARYYCCSLRQVYKVILPAIIRKNKQHREQMFITRAQSIEALVQAIPAIRESSAVQALVLEKMVLARKGMFLTELLEEANVSRSPVDTLVKKGFLNLEKVYVERSPLEKADYFRSKPKKLNREQEKAYLAICKTITERTYQTHLLYGITGSGKTEVYLQAIDHAIQMGLSAIVLVPEIALTTQMIERFRARFEEKIAILHHRLSDGERFDEWHRIRKGEASIVLGARSALFCPLPNLGLIIVDEEHESSYKQSEEAPCYHARDAAVMRGLIEKCTIVLGSATPSLESFYNAHLQKYQLHRLCERPDNATLPPVTIIDMKIEDEKSKRRSYFSQALLNGIEKRIEKGEQTILFLNRRGYHTALICSSCQETIHCTQCDTALTFHKNENSLACHLCGYEVSPPPRYCPKCNSETMKFVGVGTQQIEKALHAIFPKVRTIRMDGDTTRHKGSHQKLIRDFRTGKANVLIGTQMIAKGLHFPEVSLVGVINCDQALHLPDFRASENVFQLMMQVAGRAGRAETKGEVILQTRLPENRTIQLASAHDYLTFYREEMESRELFNYPPFARFIKITFSDPNEEQLKSFALQFQETLIQYLPKTVELFPLMPCGYQKIKNRFRYQFLLKGKSGPSMQAAIHKAMELKLPSNLRINIDVDPISTYF